MRLWETIHETMGGKEINGYPFTTSTDLPDFLGIILRVLSDDLATMLTTKHSGEGIPSRFGTDFYRFLGLSWET